ncbi:MAG: hypothetical protein GX444_00310 [Myxococcales bacterium]|nr:hypothetical protein [Myxococcales bacterium]
MRKLFIAILGFFVPLAFAVGAGIGGETTSNIPRELIGQWLFVPETEAEYDLLDQAGEIEIEFRQVDSSVTVCLGEAEKILITISGESRISEDDSCLCNSTIPATESDLETGLLSAL